MAEKISFRSMAAVLLLGAVVLLLFGPGLWGGKVLFVEDISQLHVPQKLLFSMMGHSGKLFFWNPYLLSGSPNLWAAYFYPFNLVFYFLAPQRAMVWAAWLQIFLGAFFMFLYLRSLKLGNLESVAGGALFGLSGFMLSETRHIDVLSGAVWLPLLFLGWDSRRKAPFYLPLAALAVGMQVLAGNPQVVYISGLGLGFKILWEILDAREEPRPGFREGAGSWLFILICGLLLGAVHLFPNLVLWGETARQAVRGSAFANTFAWSGKEFFPFFLPEFFPHIAPDGVVNYYLGLSALALVLPALFKGDRRKWFWLALTLFSLLISLGAKGGLNTFLTWVIPVHKVVRAPYRFMLLGVFSLSVLAALGLGCLRRFSRPAAWAAVIFLLAEMFWLAKGSLPFTGADFYRPAPALARAAQSESGSLYPPRCLVQNGDNNQTSFTGFSCLGGYSPLISRAYLEYLFYNDFARLPDALESNYIRVQPGNFQGNMMALLDLKYVFRFSPGSRWEAEAFLNPEPSRRFFLVSDYRVIKDRELMLKTLRDPAFKPFSQALLNADPGFPARSGKEREGKARLLIYRPDYLALETRTVSPALLVLSEIAYPGWEARIDGQKAPLLTADYILRAAVLPPGGHRVEFLYRPPGLIWGAAVSLLTLLFLVFSGLHKRLR